MDLVTGGAAGQAFSILYELVKDTAIKNKEFRPTLEKIKTTLEALKPSLDEIEKSNKKLKLPESELSGLKKAMEDGEVLIRKCSDVHWLKIFTISAYKDKLDEFDETLRRLIKIIGMQGVRDVKETSIMLRELLDATMKKGRIEVSNLNTSTASCDVPQLPRYLIKGLDGPLDELKKRLLNTDKSLLLVTAMGGCGKTLLAQKFCHDPQVKGTHFFNFFSTFLVSNLKGQSFIV